MKESRKAKAFALFSQGCVPSSQEIKDLKLHSSTRYKYFNEWKDQGKPETTKRKGTATTISSTTPSGEKIGAVDETRTKPKAQAPEVKPEEPPAPKEQLPLPGVEEEPKEEPEGEQKEPEELWPEDIAAEEAAKAAEEAAKARQKPKETVGGVSEVAPPATKDGKAVEPERKIATTVAEEGIKCTVLLSLQTLTLFSIARSTQTQYSQNGEDELSMGDFLDTCAEDFFRVRGKKLGLINSGGK